MMMKNNSIESLVSKGICKPSLENVFETTNYSIFKKCTGNRDVAESRVKKLIDSIKTVGWRKSFITVNKNMEVIDGQGRIEALKRLKMPVPFVVDADATIRECIAMNMNGTKWGIKDYIKSYADQGKPVYQALYNFMKRYPKYNSRVISFMLTGMESYIQVVASKGTLDIPLERFTKAEIAIIPYLQRFHIKPISVLNDKGGACTYLYNAIIFAAQQEGIDRERLYQKVSQNYMNLPRFRNTPTCLQVIEVIYNRKLPVERKVYLYNAFQQEYDRREAMNRQKRKAKK